MKKNLRVTGILMLFGVMMFFANNSFAQDTFEVSNVEQVQLKGHYEAVFSHQIPAYRFERFILPTSKNLFYWTRVRDRRLELDPSANVSDLNAFINNMTQNIPTGK